MIKIYDERESFFQWDLDRKVIVEEESITEVHFCNYKSNNSLVCEVYEENGIRFANVPNVLLQETYDLYVYAYDKNFTKYQYRFKIIPRIKPSDYVYTETEIYSYHKLEKRIDDIEAKGISDEQLQRNLDSYFEKNPIEVPIVDLTGYATEEYVNNAVNNIEIPTVDLSDYAKKSEIPTVPTKVSELNNDVGYLTQHQDLSTYALKSEIPDVSGFANKSEIPDVSGYLTANELVDYAKKTDIPDVSAYQTETQVNTLISNALNAIGVAEEGAY